MWLAAQHIAVRWRGGGVWVDLREWLAREGYDEKMGARPMQRLIQEKIKRQLAEDLLFGDLVSGGTVHVGIEENDLSIKVLSATEA